MTSHEEDMNIAIITGASSGLGAWYARLLDAEGLDELWLIARREKRLQTIAGLVRTPARVLALDLADEDAARIIEDELATVETPEVRWLVNCAGFGCIGRAGEIPLATLAQMVQVNCTAPLRLISAALPFMNAGSCILNVASCAAFQPVPGIGVYAATKSPSAPIGSATRNSSAAPRRPTRTAFSRIFRSRPTPRPLRAAPSGQQKTASASARPMPSRSSTALPPNACRKTCS